MVSVAAISLGRAEVDDAMASGEDGSRPGRDFAGTVIAAAADGTGPVPGSRVVGLVQSGAWAEFVAVSSDALAELPSTVSFAQAATLPVAGLTALHALSKGGLLAAKRVLVTGAACDVGMYAIQLAQASGAFVAASISTSDHQALIEDCGADHVIVGDISAAAEFGPFHLVADTQGGRDLSAALRLLRKGGIYVLWGAEGMPDAALDAQVFLSNDGIQLQSFILFEELRREPASEGLQRLIALVRVRTLKPHIEIEQGWMEINSLAQRLRNPDLIGKSVLRL